MLRYEDFKNCGCEYRSAPFWSWNDELKPEELVRQIREMRKQGMGGFFMHPRGGMSTEYLGDKFMEAVKACVEEAKRSGMKAWLYDEDRFPSGSAGGLLINDRDEFRAKALVMKEVPCRDVVKKDLVLKIYAVDGEKLEGSKLMDISHLEEKEIRQKEGRVLVFEMVYRQGHYPDVCNKAAIDEFIEITHEKYKKEVGSEFGGVIPGIFTDEPNFNTTVRGQASLPWSQDLGKEFQRIKGYDLLENLPSLFLETGDWRRIRFDFWDVLSGMFVKAFSKNIYDWCEKNNLAFTGHYWEHVFPSPVYTGSVMPNYEYMQVPGIDMLFNTKEEMEQFGFDLIVKEVSSVANQLGKKRVLSETYGASGWDLDFEDQKKVADWQFALGINLVCQHLLLYSMKGYRKRDFPLSFFEHQPWWDCYHILGDYIGRLSYILSQGEYKADILLLHPASSTWAEFSPLGKGESLERIGKSARTLTKKLNQMQYLFDLGDDIIIERHGRVEGNRFIVGKMSYATVLLPDMVVMRRSNFELLKQFAQNGGTIIATGMTPYLLDGREDEELKAFFSSDQVIKASPDKGELSRLLEEKGGSRVCLQEANGKDLSDIYCHHRVCDGKEILFLCSINKEESYKTKLLLDGLYEVEEWDPLTGERRNLPVSGQDGKTWVELFFSPIASHLLVLSPAKELLPMAEEKERQVFHCLVLADWAAERQDYNALTLNTCKTSTDGITWSQEENVVAADDRLKDQLGLERGHIFARQPWMYSEEEKNRVFEVKAKYTFHIAEELAGELYIASESPELFKVLVNGKVVAPTGRVYKDKAFMLYDIKEAAAVGENEVVLETGRYGVLVNLESIYVVGDFKLEKTDRGWALIREKTKPEIGNWAEKGYPYYSGAFDYKTKFTLDRDPEAKVELELGEWWGVALRVLVNGKDAGILGWKPYILDITDFVQAGENEIVVKVMNSLQNLLGPHDYLPVEGIVTPGSFYSPKAVKFQKSGFSGEAFIKIIR